MSTTAITTEELLKIQDKDESALESVLAKLQPILDKNYKKYKYLPRETFELLFKKGIVFFISNTKVKNIVNFYEYVEDKFMQIIDFQIGIAVNSDKTIIFNYYEQLKKDHLIGLSRFFNKIHADLDIDFYVELIEKYPELSSKLHAMIGDTKVIKSDVIDRLSNNTYVEQFIRSYMLKNNIEEVYEDEEELDEDLAEELDDKDQDESSKKTNNIQDFSDIPDFVKQYLYEIGTIPLLSIEQEREYFHRLRAGEEKYRELIINSNLRLAVSVAKRYTGRGLLLLDLIQEGNLGLMKATDLFDVDKGYKFSTYATWWIRQAITRAIGNDSRTVRLPVHVHEKVNAIRKAQRQFSSLHAREATYEELSAILDLPVENIAEYLAAANNPTSLSHPIGDDGESELEDFIPDEKLSVEDEAISSDFKIQVRNLIETTKMDDRLKEVIRYRFGFYGRVYTLEEVGAIFGVTRERIRQMEAKALGKLRRNRATNAMTPYMDDPERAKLYLKVARSTSNNGSHAQLQSFSDEPTLKHIKGEVQAKKPPKTLTKTGSQSLQEYLHIPYNKQEYLYDVIVALDEKDMNLIVRQFGEDFKGLKKSNLKDDERNRLFVIILPTLSKILDKLLQLSPDSMEYSNIIEKIPNIINSNGWRAPTPEEAKQIKKREKESQTPPPQPRAQRFNMLEYFNYAFKFEELTEAIKLLSDKEIETTMSICGPKLDGEDNVLVSKEERSNFGKYYLKKIKSRLAKLYPERAEFLKLPANPVEARNTNDIPHSLKNTPALNGQPVPSVELPRLAKDESRQLAEIPVQPKEEPKPKAATPAVPKQVEDAVSEVASQVPNAPAEVAERQNVEDAPPEETPISAAIAKEVNPTEQQPASQPKSAEQVEMPKQEKKTSKKGDQNFNMIAYFSSAYTFEELMEAIKLLKDIEITTIMAICGPKLDGENTTTVDKKERIKLNSNYLPKIKTRLAKLYPERAEFAKLPKKASGTPPTGEQSATLEPHPEENAKTNISGIAQNIAVAPASDSHVETASDEATQNQKQSETAANSYETFVPTFDLIGYFDNKYTYEELRRVIVTLTSEEKEMVLKICGSRLSGQNTSEVKKITYEKFINECLPKIKNKAETQQTTNISSRQRRRIQRVVASSGRDITSSPQEPHQDVKQPIEIEAEVAIEAAPDAPTVLDSGSEVTRGEAPPNPIERRTGAKNAKKAEVAPAPGRKPFKIVPVPDLPQINIGLATPTGGEPPVEEPTLPKEPPITRRRPPVINIPSFEESSSQEPVPEKSSKTELPPVNNGTSTHVEERTQSTDEGPKPVEHPESKEQTSMPQQVPNKKTFSLNDLKLIKEIINQPEFQTMIKMSFTIEEVLVALMLHYGFNGETFSVVEIANFLHADPETIKDIARRSIGKYKELMNQKFDEYEQHILSKIDNPNK